MALTGEEIKSHNSKDSCWVIVHGKCYDVTEFLPGKPHLVLSFLVVRALTCKAQSIQEVPKSS